MSKITYYCELEQDEKDSLDRSMTKMSAQWYRFPKEKLPQKRESFSTMLREVGISRFEEAVHRAVEAAGSEGGLGEFPKPGELRAYVPDGDQPAYTRNQKCPACGGRGWVVVKDYEQFPNGVWQERVVRRCHDALCVQWVR